jgi:hypothetical protein
MADDSYRISDGSRRRAIEAYLPDLIKALAELAAGAEGDSPPHAARLLARCQQVLTEHEQRRQP